MTGKVKTATVPRDGGGGSGGVAIFTRIVAIVLAFGLFADRAAALPDLVPRIGDMQFNILQVFAFWADFLAAGFYICALWDLGSVFSRLHRGDAFGPAMVRGILGCGTWLIVGALAALGFAPALANFVGVSFGPETLELKIMHTTFLFIGAALVMLARRGARLTSELEAFV